MKLSAILSAVALAACSTAAPLMEEEYKVPGDSVLKFCTNPEDYLLSVEKIDTIPVMPEAGKNLTIEFTGALKKQVEDGAYVLLEVKYGPYIKLVNERMDICENAESVDKKCPLKASEVSIKKSVALPGVIPPGAYHVQADAYTKDGERITCLKADISFGKSPSMFFQSATGHRENIL